MHLVRFLLLLIAITASVFMVFGLYKPWLMLWWEDTQNRKKVIKVYGTIACLSYAMYWLLIFFEH